MKLRFKSSLTSKLLRSKNLQAILNCAVLTFFRHEGRRVPARYRFGSYELDPEASTLMRNGDRVKLQDLPYRLLLMLVEQPGVVVSREAVRQRLWPENTVVEFDNSLGVAVRKIRDALGDDADAPIYLETIPRKGYRFLVPVIAIGAEKAASPAETPHVPFSVSLAQPAPTTLLASKKISRYWAIGAIAVLAIASGIYGVNSLRRKMAAKQVSLPLEAPVRVRRSVAVIGFRNLPGRPEDAWLSSAFAEMLTTELAADGSLRMVSGEDVARARHELPLNTEDSLAKSTLDRLRTDPGADVVVLGSYTPLPGKGEKRIRLDVRLQDTVRGETIAEQAFVGNEDDLFELVTQAGASLRQNLGATPVSGEVVAQARAALPTKPLAVKLYAEGLERLWAFDFVKARDFLIQAAAVETEFPLTHAALSDAWDHLGYTLKARDEAERARALSQHLGPEGRLQIEGRYYASLQDTSKTIEVYRKLFARFPDSLDYGLRLADQQRRVHPDDALPTLTVLRQLPPPVRDDPRLDILEARIWMDRDDARTQAAARRAVEKGTAQGSSLLVAHAYGVLCQTLGNGSSTAQAIQDCENARQSYAAAGDRNNEARTEGDFAGLYYQLGDLDRAQKMFREAIAVFREVGDIQGISAGSGNLGDVALAKGNLDEAARVLADAIPGYKEMGDKDGVALTLNDLGEVARRRGDLKKAMQTYEQAKMTAQEIDDKRALAYILGGIGDVLLDRSDLAAAQKSYEESLAIRRQIGDKQAAAQSQLSLARLAIEEGRAADAEAVIRACKEQFHQDQQADDELYAGIVLIAAFVAESKVAQAENTIEQTRPLSGKSANKFLQLQFDIESARTEAASGHGARARAKIEKVIQIARSHRLGEVELEARLASADVEKGLLRSSEVPRDLLTLEDAARRRGFILIANKARSLRIGS
jgi:DNA-binding winged helix-turn-helix (wHTH) protein/tetratricopeptide (TPR) repeat protein